MDALGRLFLLTIIYALVGPLIIAHTLGYALSSKPATYHAARIVWMVVCTAASYGGLAWYLLTQP